MKKDKEGAVDLQQFKKEQDLERDMQALFGVLSEDLKAEFAPVFPRIQSGEYKLDVSYHLDGKVSQVHLMDAGGNSIIYANVDFIKKLPRNQD